MVLAVLLLIVAADLLVNGVGLQPPPTQLADILPAPARPVR